MNIFSDINPSTVEKRKGPTFKHNQVQFGCFLKNKSLKKKKQTSFNYNAVLNFPKGVETKKLTLKTGVYNLNDVDGPVKKEEEERNTEYKKNIPSGIFVWNPSRKQMLPILGVVVTLGNVAQLKDRILVFKRKRRRRAPQATAKCKLELKKEESQSPF